MTSRALPGDLPYDEQVKRMIRVNHAGEYGAKRIYAGQLAVLKNSPSAPIIRHMAEQEEPHLKYFSEALTTRRIRPSLLHPLWHAGGWALGAATALLGEKAAMACTAAVESAIDEHYGEQENTLRQDESELKQHIHQFRAEEKEHHDTAIDHGAEETPFYALLHNGIKLQTKMAIWLATRI